MEPIKMRKLVKKVLREMAVIGAKVVLVVLQCSRESFPHKEDILSIGLQASRKVLPQLQRMGFKQSPIITVLMSDFSWWPRSDKSYGSYLLTNPYSSLFLICLL